MAVVGFQRPLACRLTCALLYIFAVRHRRPFYRSGVAICGVLGSLPRFALA